MIVPSAASLASAKVVTALGSVGAVDAVEQQTSFSNSGAGLKMTAPGLDIYTAGLNGERRTGVMGSRTSRISNFLPLAT